MIEADMTAEAQPYTFSWHDKNDNDIWNWLVIHIIGAHRTADEDKDEFFNTLMGITDGGKECTITMQINGIEIDTKKLFERLVDNMEWIATKEASKIVSEIPGFNKLSELIYNTQNELKYELRKSLRSMGLQIYEDD